MSPGSSGHTATQPVGVAGSARHEPVASSASTTLGGGSASGSLARFELSAQARRRSEDLTPAASTTSERSAMLAHPSTELVARAPCQLRQSHARPVRAARARLRQQRRLEVDKTRKRGVQTGGVAAPRGFTKLPPKVPHCSPLVGWSVVFGRTQGRQRLVGRPGYGAQVR